MYNIVKLRDHAVLDFAYEELCGIAASQSTNNHIEIEGKPEQWVIGTWNDCEEHLSLDESVNMWPWTTLGSSTYDHDTYSIIRNGHQWILTGKSERSTLYAVYEYCKKHWQMEWIYPGESAVFVPRLSSQSAEVNIEQPVFERRGFVYENLKDESYLIDVVDWLAKNKINELFLTFPLWQHLRRALEPELQKRGIDLTLGGHSMKFFTEGLHAIGMNHDGTAPAFAGYKQLNYEDESWQQIVISDILTYCQTIPMLTRISLWPEDTAVSDDLMKGNPFIALYLRFTERLQEALNHAGSEVKAEHIAYNAGLSWDMLELHEGMETSSEVDTLFAYWGRDYSQGFPECKRKEEQRAYQMLESWVEGTTKKNKDLTIFEYYSDHYMLSHLFPSMPERIYDDLTQYHSLGIKSIVNLVVPYPQADDTYSWKWAQGYNSYVFARAAWGDPLTTIVEDYWCYSPEEERAYIRQTMERVGEILARISYFNILLFPARVVDVHVARLDESESVTLILEELNIYLQSVIADMKSLKFKENFAFEQYFTHLLMVSGKLAEEWKGKLDRNV